MTSRQTHEIPLRSAVGPRAQTLTIAALLLTGAAMGCGGGEDGASDEFLGIWTIDFTKSTFDLTCPAPNADQSGPLELWDSGMVFERGVVSDLIELSGGCQFQFNVAGKIASIPNPDPVTGLPPVCRLNASDPPGTIFGDIVPAWEFRVLKPEKGKPPTAQLVSLNPPSTLTFVHIVDGLPMSDPPCTYAAQANLTKFAQF